jgi:hypothetical protein
MRETSSYEWDKMIGKDFETGLASLKAIAEKKTAQGRVPKG